MNLRNKPSLQMSPGQSGSGSPWSLFEDQVIVVFVFFRWLFLEFLVVLVLGT
jgi:hypothetical protein